MAKIIEFPKIDSFEIPANMTPEEIEAKVDEIMKAICGEDYAENMDAIIE